MRPYRAVTPLDAIKQKASEVQYTLGALAHKRLPDIAQHLRTTTEKPGFTVKFYSDPPSVKERQAIDEMELQRAFLFLVDYANPLVRDNTFYAEIEGTMVVEEDGVWDFGIMVRGTAQLFVDSELIVDNLTTQRAGDSFFGSGTVEERGSAELKAGREHKIVVQFGSSTTSNYEIPEGVAPIDGGGLSVGAFKRVDPQAEIDRAVTLAREVDQVVICAGLNVSVETSPQGSSINCRWKI